MPGENLTVAELEGQVADMEAQISSLTKKLGAATDGNATAQQVAELTGQLDEMTKALEDASTAIEQMTAQNKELAAVAKMSPTQKAWYDKLKEKGEEGEEEKDKFLEMKDEEKDEEVKKRMANDETVTIEGQVIRKSAVGDTTFAVMKAQADRIAKTEANLAIEKAARETATLEKRADDEFKHVPGTTQERGQMLGAIAKMDEPLRKAFEAVFTQSEKLAKNAFEKIGHKGGKDNTPTPLNKAIADFDSKVTEIGARDKCTKTEAISKARKEFPDLFKAYQEHEAQAN